MFTLNAVSKSFGSRILFDKVSVAFNEGHRYGLTGPNGAGKSTLMKIMMGQEEPTSGTITLPKKVGWLKQNIEAFKEFKVLDVVIQGNERLWEALQERDRLYEEEFTDEIGMRLGDLEGIIAEEDGYSADSDAEVLLEGMGIEKEHYNSLMSEIPTDVQFQVLLCQALFGNPQALLLDEPTNHLDLKSIRWLENFLLSYKGVLIVISHDRHFLNAVTTDIADIDYESIIIYPGNYDNMVVTKTAVRERALQDAKSQEKKITQLKDFVAKFSAGTRASQVQSRLKEIERLKPEEMKQSNIQRPYIRFIPTDPSGQITLKVDKISKGYEGHQVLKNVSFEVMRGDKIGVIGCNGLGKTTLIKILAGVLAPDDGKVELGHNVKMSYFPQNHADVIKKEEKITSFEWLKNKKPHVYEQEIRSALGKLLFSGDEAFKNVNTLSGGETARLLLAGIIVSEHNLLILDEPNNHLDLEAVSALAWGLEEYKGTVVVVSHDRDLIDKVATKIIAFEKDGVHVFNGPLEEYLAQK
jgi:ATPase subunit of ABC transporter with duplicated ATPase domains